MRLIVCGGRDYHDRAMMFAVLDQLHACGAFEDRGIACVIAGGAPGADTLAVEWADSRGVVSLMEPAEWELYGRRAGPIRNQKMLDVHQPTHVLAFPGGAGTRDMIRRAKRAGVPVIHPSANGGAE